MPLAETHHVVVDGSNLATEGRTFPSLKQLDEAVRAYAAEDPDASIIVVVDATFEHRVSDAEREEVRQAMLNGEIISPPAGAIGRGDAFVLRIAERTGATVLSNDSFQEFHGEHPWLFDDGRLIGGKPVPGVGWIFTPAAAHPRPQEPRRHRRGQGEEGPRVRPRQGRRAGQGGQEGRQEGVQGEEERPEAGGARSTPPGRSRPRRRPRAGPRSNPVFSSAIDEAVEEALHPPTAREVAGRGQEAAPRPRRRRPQKRAKAKKDAPGGKGRDDKARRPGPRPGRAGSAGENQKTAAQRHRPR